MNDKLTVTSAVSIPNDRLVGFCRRWVEASENYIRRKHILSHLEPLYVEG